jgi:hypothetical protein
MLGGLERLIEASRGLGVRFVLYFVKCRGRVGVDREIRALDEENRPAPWVRVFPGISPQSVIQQCALKRVEAYRGGELIGEWKTIEEAIAALTRARPPRRS